jgi:cytochrome c556
MLAIATLGLLAGCGEPEDTQPGRPVWHRREAFKVILRAFEQPGRQLRENAYMPADFLRQTRELAQLGAAPWAYFGAGTQYPPSRSQDRLWQEKEKFDAMAVAFQDHLRLLTAAAESQEEDKVRAAWAQVEADCRDCHKLYRR